MEDEGEEGAHRAEADEQDAEALDFYTPRGNKKRRKGYSCNICGKVYTYEVSFRKHQQMHEGRSGPSKPIPNEMHNYECAKCGMKFIRHARLRAHMRSHRYRSQLDGPTTRCEQCNKNFNSVDQWMAHVERHQQNPFWCLSCAKGFPDEESLDRHLQRHSLKPYKCKVCQKSFHMFTQLVNHYNIHTEAKPQGCTICGEVFSQPKDLNLHRKKHLRDYLNSVKNNKAVKKKGIASRVNDELEMHSVMEELAGTEEEMEEGELIKSCEDVESVEIASDVSDCGELSHCPKPTQTPESAGQELNEGETQETHVHREHKYWEWECCVCDMGFDEVEMLHAHYVKHATGELPIPPEDEV